MGRFDFYSSNAGFVILDYPYYLNLFLDQFHLDILATAAEIPLLEE